MQILTWGFYRLILIPFPLQTILYKLQGFSLMVNKLQFASSLSSDILLVMVLPDWKRDFFQTLNIRKSLLIQIVPSPLTTSRLRSSSFGFTNVPFPPQLSVEEKCHLEAANIEEIVQSCTAEDD